MAKTRTDFVCRECGYRTPRSLGRCPECDAWGSFDEVSSNATAPATNGRIVPAGRPVHLAEIAAADFERLGVPIEEFARVMGGGIVRGSLTLIGGDPGVGKSTLLTQVASAIDDVLYVSGEESIAQVGLRAQRMALASEHVSFLSETDAEVIVETIRRHQPALAIIDSIQSVMTSDVDGLPGSVSQLRECALRFLKVAKSTGTPVFLVGHVTKDGAIAGPKLLEHMVDTVLYLEGERFDHYRLLRSTKNRFGPTHEVGVFEMRGDGLAEVANPSALFLAERAAQGAGSVVTVAMEGTRPILQEIQALVSRSSLAIPRRTSTGFDANRLHLIAAVLSRRAGVALYDQDVYLNVVGGLRVDEPAGDLAAALAIISAARDHALPAELVAIGELGLAGEVRGVSQIDARLREAAKLGFTHAVVPRSVARRSDGIHITPVGALRDAIAALHI